MSIAGLVVLALVRSRPLTPQRRVEQHVVEMVASLDRHDVGGVMKYVSERFAGAQGLDRDAVRALLVSQVVRREWARVFLVDLDVHPDDPGKVAVSARIIFGRSDARSLKDLAKESVLSAWWIRARAEPEPDGDWRFVWAEYQSAEP